MNSYGEDMAGFIGLSHHLKGRLSQHRTLPYKINTEWSSAPQDPRPGEKSPAEAGSRPGGNTPGAMTYSNPS
jgi:hypothetical protein